MSLPLELAPLIFQFLPVKTIEEFPQNDALLIAVLKIQNGCRPFKVYYEYFGTLPKTSVEHMGFVLRKTITKEVLSSLGVVHRVYFASHMPDKFASMFVKNDKADDSFPFPRVEILEVSCKHRKFSKIDLTMFPKLKELFLIDAQRGIKISPRSRTMLLSCIIGLPGGGSTVEGVCDISSDVDISSIEMNMDRSHGFIVLAGTCVDWKACFDRSWCRSMELWAVSYSKNTIATLEGFPNLKSLQFLKSTIELSQKWLPNLPLEVMSFWCCHIVGTEFGSWPLVKELKFRQCLMEPVKGHFPQLESFIFHEKRYMRGLYHERFTSVPIAKENLRRVSRFLC